MFLIRDLLYIFPQHFDLNMALFRKLNNDHEIIAGVLSKGNQQRAYENRLYEKYLYLIREGVWKHKLTEDECSMAYSDTILTVIENIQAGVFEGRSELKTYAHQIFNNKCVDLIRKNTTNKQQVNRGVGIDDLLFTLPDESRSIVDVLITRYDTELLHRRINELGEKCRRMILAWGEGFMDQEIAGTLGYQSAAVVKTSRLRCLDKLRSLYKGTDTPL
jgi:RNA polymerase sigma-70 factor (ECF subfamily)